MRLVLTWFVKEWWAQRAGLAAYLAVSFAVVAGVFALRTFGAEPSGAVPGTVGSALVVLFLAAAVFGLAGIAAPQLVRGELCGGTDQLLRRLPGALGPACAGKLAFLLVAACVLLSLAVLAALALLAARGVALVPPSWFSLPQLGARLHQLDGIDLTLAGTWYAAAALPLVAAAASWLPRARMALGAVVLLGLLLALAVSAVLRAHHELWPGMKQDSALSWTHGVAYAGALGLVVAWVSLARGRRGGGPLRSVALGGFALVIGLLPPGMWLGGWVWAYRIPDPHSLRRFFVCGLTPDLRHVLAEGAAGDRWPVLPLRIDLTTGAVDRLGSVGAAGLWPHLLQRGTPAREQPRQRYWKLYRDGGACLLDATTLDRVPMAFDAATKLHQVPPELRDALRRERAATTPFRAPGNRPAWVEGDRLCVEGEDGDVLTSPFDPHQVLLWPRGHGVAVARAEGKRAWLDLTTRDFVASGTMDEGSFAVHGCWLVRDRRHCWQRLDPRTGIATPAPALSGLRLAHPLVLLDDDTVLVKALDRVADRRARWKLFAYSVSLEQVARIACADPTLAELDPTDAGGNAYGLRDPRNRLWVKCTRRHDAGNGCQTVWVAIDPRTRTAHATGVEGVDVVAFLDPRTVLGSTPVQPGQLGSLVRIDLETGARTVVFPRGR